MKSTASADREAAVSFACGQSSAENNALYRASVGRRRCDSTGGAPLALGSPRKLIFWLLIALAVDEAGGVAADTLRASERSDLELSLLERKVAAV